ncbi:TPA: hypothetical protein ACS7Z7_000313 [Providencia alcalifaciens]
MQKKYIIKQDDLQNDLITYTKYSDSELTYAKKNADVILEIKEYIESNDKINANEIMMKIFPVNEPHIFISHKSEHSSHAIRLANIIYEKFKIVSFIDSQVWHHIDDVSNMINQKVSKIREDGNTTIYNHKSTSIVASNMFAMLSSSLFEVMDCSDGFIYIDSNSQSEIDEIEKGKTENLKTKSPWIFLEMTYASKLRKKMHKRPHFNDVLKESSGLESLSESVEIEFDYSKEIIDSVRINTISDVLRMEALNHPLYNLDEIYKLLDDKFKLNCNEEN